MANISDLMGDKDRQIISNDNSEPDKKIANGLLLESPTRLNGRMTPGHPIQYGYK